MSQGEGAVTTLSLLLPLPFKTKTREGMHYCISEIILKISQWGKQGHSKCTAVIELLYLKGPNGSLNLYRDKT